MTDLKTAHLQTEKGFRAHVHDNRHNIVRQPVVCAQSGAVLHHEWLVRFDSDTGLEKILRPAEINGSIADLDLAMLKSAVAALNLDPTRKPIAVNLSGASFSDPGFEHSILDILTYCETPASRLKFELTETWNLFELAPVISLVTLLRDRGHELCLDDVGAGAASIRYLRALPADWLKIDGDFVAGAYKNARELAVLKAVMGLRADLGVRFIAEGIDSAALRDFAVENGFDALQGYYLGAPEPENSRSG